MQNEEFVSLREKMSKFKYTSMNYTDAKELSEYKMVCQNEKLVLLYGYNKETKKNQYHWASNTCEDLINEMDSKNTNILLTFVPPEWVDKLKSVGFEIFAVWNEYNNKDITNIECNIEPEYLTEEYSEEASKVTLSCRGQSRGFTGQTTNWIKAWIKGEDSACIGIGTKDCKIITHRENGEIAGIVCTGVYGHNNKKGPVAWIREVAVDPKFQNRGIARKLILQALNYCKKHGATRAFLMADECNVHAIHLYQSLGFEANKDETEINMIKE